MKKDRVVHECVACGAVFEKPRSATGKFCSMKCLYASRERVHIYDRLWAKIAKTESDLDCWLWTGAKLKSGYGSISNGTRMPTLKAHRVAFESANGPIPDGAFILHKCDVPLCCNPSHLYIGDAKQNAKDINDRNRRNDFKKLSDDDISAIITLSRDGHTGRYISCLFGVSEGYISMLINGKANRSSQ